MSSWRRAIAEQQRANERSWHHRESFEGHRAALTRLLAGPDSAQVSLQGGGRLCVLGAGNCADLDLVRLTSLYEEVHLVDLDGAALTRALQVVDDAVAARITLHPGIDLSGLQNRIERWKALQVTPAELMDYPEQTARFLREKLPAPFDRVVSACLLSQMHLSVRRVLTEAHQLFGAVAFCLNLAHLRTLLALTATEGSALLACDVASDEIAPLHAIQSGSALELLAELQDRGTVFQAVDPRTLVTIAKDDPILLAKAAVSAPQAAWLWQNGPQRRFLVYALAVRPTT